MGVCNHGPFLLLPSSSPLWLNFLLRPTNSWTASGANMIEHTIDALNSDNFAV